MATPGPRDRPGQGGYALLDVVLALGIAALFALLTLAGFARGSLRVHAAALTFAALMARVESGAAGRALRDAGAPASSGLTLTLRATSAGALAEVYRGRPGPGVALPLQPEPAIPPVTFDAGVSGLPISIFVDASGGLSLQPAYDAGTSTQTLASEPACAPGGAVEVVFHDRFRSETDAFACAGGARVAP